MTGGLQCPVSGRQATTVPIRRMLSDETGSNPPLNMSWPQLPCARAVGASRLIARVLVSYLHHMYLVVTLPVP